MTQSNEYNASVPQEWELPEEPIFDDIPTDTVDIDANYPLREDTPMSMQEQSANDITVADDDGQAPCDIPTAAEAPWDETDETSEDDTEDKESNADDILDSTEDEDISATDSPTSARAHVQTAKVRRVDSVFDFVELAVFTLVIVLTLTVFLFRHSIVDGGSMESTLQDGDHLIISSLFYTPEAGDIIVFENSSAHNRPLVKRIIATEGQEVLILSDTEVYVDGEPVIGGYVDGVSDYAYPISCTVSEGCVFVLGDHRNNSADSRKFGEIPIESILGKVLIRFYPLDSFGIPGELPKETFE